MKTETKEELRGLLKEVAAPMIAEAVQQSKESEEKWKEELSKENKTFQSEVKSKLEALEKASVTKELNIPGTEKSTEIHFGYKMQKQLVDVNNKFEKYINPKAFPVLSNPEKSEGFAKHMLMIIKASTGDFKAQQAYQDWIAKADLVEGTNNVGGYLVPTEYTNEIMALARLTSFALQDCRVWPMSSDKRSVPVEATRASMTWTAENTDATETNPTFAEILLDAKRLTGYIPVTNELLGDVNVDIASYLLEMISQGIGDKLDATVLNGTTGGGDPFDGVLQKSGITTVDGGLAVSNLDGDDLADAIDKIDQEAEAGAKFYMHKTVFNYVRKLKDSNGNYIFGPLGAAAPATIFEYPYLKTPNAPTATSVAATKSYIAFGNMRYFALGRREEPIGLDVNPFLEWKKNKTLFKVEARFGGGLGIATAFSRIKRT